MEPVGFIGTGAIGQPMAGRLIEAGFALVVHDLDSQAVKPLLAMGAREAKSCREVADQCDVVIVSLPGPAALRAVALGEEGLTAGKRARVIINTCTVGAPLVEEIAQALAPSGRTLIDCPISGGKTGAAAGTLSVMVSGAPGDIEAVRPLLSAWGKITIAGEKPGAAQVLKLVNNALSIVAMAATSEAFVMGAKAGLDPEVMTQAINAGSGRNSATQDKFPRAVLDRSFDISSAMQITVKDIDLAARYGEELGVPMWVCHAARLIFKHAQFETGPLADTMEVVRFVERAAKFEIPKTRGNAG